MAAGLDDPGTTIVAKARDGYVFLMDEPRVLQSWMPACAGMTGKVWRGWAGLNLPLMPGLRLNMKAVMANWNIARTA